MIKKPSHPMKLLYFQEICTGQQPIAAAHVGAGNPGVGKGWEELPSGDVNSLLLKMAIEIVSCSIQHGEFP